MQVKIYSVPIVGGEKQLEELNVFLRSKKVLEYDKQLISHGPNAYWSFCIGYIDEAIALSEKEEEKEKIDYKLVLDEATFARFSKMREIRKQLTESEGVPAYAIFLNTELVSMSKVEDLTLAKMKKIKGVGEKKIEKYGKYFISNPILNPIENDETL